MRLAGLQVAPPSLLISIPGYISENFPIARSGHLAPQRIVPSLLIHFHTSHRVLHSASHLCKYHVAYTPESAIVSNALPSDPNKFIRTPQIVPDHVGSEGNPGLSGLIIELAHIAPTRVISAIGMRVNLRDIEWDGRQDKIRHLAALRCPKGINFIYTLIARRAFKSSIHLYIFIGIESSEFFTIFHYSCCIVFPVSRCENHIEYLSKFSTICTIRDSNKSNRKK